MSDTQRPVTGISAKDLAGLQPQDEPYSLGPDSLPQPGVPRGDVLPFHWSSHRIYPDTERDYWLYVPRQYDAAQPACLMVSSTLFLLTAPLLAKWFSIIPILQAYILQEVPAYSTACGKPLEKIWRCTGLTHALLVKPAERIL